MTDTRSGRRRLADSLGRTVARARLMTGLERLVVALTPLAAVVMLVIALALFGLWQWVPAPLAFGLTGLAAIAVLASLWPLRRFRWPAVAEARRRVEQQSQFRHRPVETLADSLGAGATDPAGRRLWDAHLARMRAAARNARTGAFEPRVAAADPLALRVLPALLLVIAIVASRGEVGDRLAAIINPPQAAAAAAPLRIDAWVTPPVYTGRPPIFLTRAADVGENDPAGTAGAPAGHTVPEGSRLTVRVQPGDGIALIRKDAAGETPVDGSLLANAGTAEAPASFEVEIADAAEFRLSSEAGDLDAWAFDVLADTPPEIAYKGDPQAALSGALTVTYLLKDDYGIIGARAEIEQAGTAGGKPGRPLFEAPELALMLPQSRTRDAEGQTTRDLMQHPWAGSDVAMTLVARDEAGQTGRSRTLAFTLPERRFHDPLARAVIEQRRILALDGDAVVPVATGLDALTIGAATFIDNSNHYLVLRSAYWRLQNARTDEDLRDVVAYLWEIALMIEDGDLSLAERRLRDAQQALMDALENGASDEEIERLMADLRQAMNDFLRELAENMQQMPDGQMPPMDPSQMVTNEDLERMLDQIETMAKSGARDAARQMLSEMQRMMENLRNAQRMPQQQGPSEMSEAMRELQEMIQRQQDLMDRTFRLEREGQQGQQGQEGQRGQQGQQGQGQSPYGEQLGELGQGQEALRQQLEEMMRRLGEMGMGQNPSLGEAGRAMGRAEQDLRGNQPGAAVGDQGEALSNLRQGTQSMLEQMMQQGDGQGQAGNPQDQRDPLGRPQRTEGPDLGNTVKVPDEIDIQRAREILQELRRRLSEPLRPKIEKDYLERLITPY